MASNLQARVHLRDAIEHLHLIEVHFMLHPQLISYIHTSVIASNGFQTTSSPSVPSLHPIVVVGIFSRGIIT